MERALELPDRVADAGADDLARSDLSSCHDSHHYGKVPLTRLATLDGGATFLPTAALRLIVDFSLRDGCDLPADVTWTTTFGDPATPVVVSAHAWLGEGDCGAARTVTREVTIPATEFANPMAVVRDGASPSSAPPLLLTAPGSFDTQCAPALPGEPCASDCDCNGSDPAMMCLALPGGVHQCGRACHEDSQCRLDDGAGFCAGAPSFVCVTSHACHVPTDCPFGESLMDCLCVPPMGLSGPAPLQCQCDAECPPGSICGDGSCVQVCTGAHTCGSYGEGEGGTACFSGQCTQLI